MSSYLSWETLEIVAVVLVAIPLYFLPSIIAHRSDHPRADLVIALNIFASPLAAIMPLLYPVKRPLDAPLEPGELPCPECGAAYDPTDYMESAPIWNCSSCHAGLPRAAVRHLQ